jgi:hypothetical protein
VRPSLVVIALLMPPVTASASLPSAFDPTVFTIAICDAQHPVDLEHPDNGCWGTVLETSWSAGGPADQLVHYLVYSFTDDPDHQFFLGSVSFKAKDAGCCGVWEKGLHRYALGGDLPPSVPEGWDLYLETRWTETTNQEYGVFARPTTTVTPEPASLLLVGSGMAGVAVWRRRRFKA